MLFQGFYVERIRNTPICNHYFSPSPLCRMNIIYFFIVFVRCKRKVVLFSYLFFIVYRLDIGLSLFRIVLQACVFSNPSSIQRTGMTNRQFQMNRLSLRNSQSISRLLTNYPSVQQILQKLLNKNRRITTCNRLNLETQGYFDPLFMPKNLRGH